MFKHTIFIAAASLLLIAAPALACGGASPAAPDSSRAPLTGPHGDHKGGKAAPHAGHDRATTGPLDHVVASYGELRAALAGDSLERAQKAGAALARAAGMAKVAAEHKRTLAGISSWAGKVAKSKDIAAARMDFGQTSRHLITVLVAHPKAAMGLTAYRCPMAAGYQKWVQSGDMANPYMGAKMLRCGGKTKMSP